uniref:Uncharacterized protein n=1 Tax=Ciona intestinalis TaxID=7719 RepID=H2XWV3_CIOIN
DVNLAIGFLMAVGETRSMGVLENICLSAGNNYTTITATAEAGLYISRFHGLLSHVPKYRMLLLDAKWAYTFTSLKIPVDGILQSTLQWKQAFLFKLITHPLITGSLLKSYCKDYKMDSDKTLLQYVDCLLAFSFNNQRTNGSRTWKAIEEELKWLTKNIVDKYELLRQLERCLRNNISAYDYDKIEFMLNLIKLNFTSADQVLDVQKGLNLLNYLLHIKRENNPTDLEKQQFWKRGSVSSKSLPSISSTRLPLHALLYGDTNHAWKVISAEVTKKSVDLLVPVAKLLKLNVDKLYMTAAENMITELLVGQIEFFYQHCNCSLNNDDLNSVEMTMIRSLVENISSCQMCVAMARRVSELIPSGAEKVESYKWCLSLLSEWKKSIPEDSSDMSSVDSVFQSINQDFRTSNIEHLLALEKLNTADVLLLVNQPANLIIHLYQHPSIIQRFYAPGDAYPDIHGVVDQVAELYDQDVARLRLTMTLKLLLTVEKKHDQDQEEDNVSQENKEEKTLIQLLYLLTYGNPLTQAKHLSRLLGDQKHRKVTNITKLRVLNCLFHIVDDDVIYNLTDKRADHLRDELQLFVYLSKLDAANFKISISHLREADKLSVVHSILSSATHRHNPDTLKVAAEMCQEFGPAPQDTWAVILQQLVALQEVSYLHQLLPNIFHIPAVSTLPCLTSVWQTCVTLPLVALTPPLDEQQNEFVVSCYHFLVLSPLLHRMNLAYVAQQFESLQLYALALGCLLASPASHDRARKLVELKGTEIEAQMEKFCGGKSPIIGHMLLSTFLSANKKT